MCKYANIIMLYCLLIFYHYRFDIESPLGIDDTVIVM